jgi:hypothetical protein
MRGMKATSSRGRGLSIFKRVCLTVATLLLLLALSAWAFFSSQRRKWTGDAPIQVELPLESSVRPVDAERLYRDTRRALEGSSARNLQFDKREFAALLKQAPELRGLETKMAMQLQEDCLLTRMSLPLDGIPGFAGRFLNGDFIFDLQIDQGEPRVSLRSGKVRGKEVPQRFLEQINQYAQRELIRNLQRQTDLKRIESLRIENGKMILKIKEKSK